jgi:hypothetical protein
VVGQTLTEEVVAVLGAQEYVIGGLPEIAFAVKVAHDPLHIVVPLTVTVGEHAGIVMVCVNVFEQPLGPVTTSVTV